MSQLMIDSKKCGGRHFGEFPFTCTWTVLRERTFRLPGAVLTTFFKNEKETWLLFTYEGFEFFLHDQNATLHFSVDGSECPDRTLQRVLSHFSPLFSPHLGD